MASRKRAKGVFLYPAGYFSSPGWDTEEGADRLEALKEELEAGQAAQVSRDADGESK